VPPNLDKRPFLESQLLNSLSSLSRNDHFSVVPLDDRAWRISFGVVLELLQNQSLQANLVRRARISGTGTSDSR